MLFGDGIRSPVLGLCALAVCMAGAIAGPGRALVLGGFAALLMASLVLPVRGQHNPLLDNIDGLELPEAHWLN